MTRILSLEVQNIKRIKALKIKPTKDGLVIISGKNGNGKSSTLDSIMMALCGGKEIPLEPVRHGEETAEIKVELDEYTVRRWWNSSVGSSQIELKLKSGAKISNAQTELNNIVGKLSFDPLEFATMKAKDQLNMLKEISGIDFASLDKEYAEKFAERTGVKRDGDSFSSMMDSYADVQEIKIEMDIEQINLERQSISEHNKKILDATQALLENNNRAKENQREIDKKLTQIDQLNEEIEELKERNDQIDRRNDDLRGIAATTKRDATELDAKVAEWHKYQANLSQLEKKKELSQKLEKARGSWSALDKRLKEILTTKEKMVKDSKMPVDGLSLGESEIIFNNVPFSQLSTSEQIKISMYVAIALNPKLRVAIIKNVSLLDSAAMKEIAKIAEEKDFQVWCEKVSDTPDGNSIFIEDGEIKSQVEE